MNQEARNFAVANWFKLFISGMVFIAVAMYGYQTFIVVPNKEKEAKALVAQNLEKLDDCVLDAEIRYSRNFKAECKRRGLPENCALPLAVGNSIEESMKNEISRCHKRYEPK